MTVSQEEARVYVTSAFSQQMGRPGTRPELQCLQAIGDLETNFGTSWHPPGVGSFNMGAIQQGGWPGEVFSYTDTHPLPDGTSKKYTINFRKYPSATDGFLDLCRVVYSANDMRKQALAAATRGDLLGFSTALHQYPCYYEGFGSTDQDRIAHHCNAVLGSIKRQCAALGEELPTAEPLPTIAPALFLGCQGPAVAAWQHVVGATPEDGIFGAKTQTATRAWQAAHKLPPSGIVCADDLIEAGLLPMPTGP
jgi:hypothetical protein